MLTKRIIPCLDVKDGRTVKGVNFVGLRDAGDPIELACKYAAEGADELVFLDITASHERRQTLLKLVKDVAQAIDIPFTVGGGIRSAADVFSVLRAGADKVTINSAAVLNPDLLSEVAEQFGAQCLVVAIDAKWTGKEWTVFIRGGREETSLELFSWAEKVEHLGAGEILFTSMDHDGTKNGFANEALAELSNRCSIPIIASGGAGLVEHFTSVFTKGKADAALAASVFHFGEIPIPDLKLKLLQKNIPVRC